MTELKGKTVIGPDGVEGRVVAVGTPARDAAPQVRIAFAGGRHALVPPDLLTPQPDGTFRLPFSLGEAAAGQADAEAASREETRLSVIEERPVVGKKTVTRTHRVVKRVRERQEVVDEPLLREQVEVTRVPVGSWVEAPVPIRQDGDTTIVPLLEEVLVVEKRLRLVEEVHITKRRHESHDPKTVTLRREEAVVEPVEAASEPRSPSS